MMLAPSIMSTVRNVPIFMRRIRARSAMDFPALQKTVRIDDLLERKSFRDDWLQLATRQAVQAHIVSP